MGTTRSHTPRGRAGHGVAALAAVTLLAAAAPLAACSDGEPRDTGAAPTPPATAGPGTGTATTAPPTAAPTGRAASGVPDLGAPQQLATGIEVPWGLTFLPDGDALVAERDTGRILRVSARRAPAREVYRVPGVIAVGEGGLLGLALSPRYADDRLVYAYHTAADDNRIVRFRLDGGTPEVVFDGITEATFHNGGRIAFGPDGMLYVGTGDAGETASSQDPDDPNGKILRLTPDGDPAPGNPTAGSPVYSLGHRNVQGLAWDAKGRLWATEFGQNRLDEVNLIQPGRNYGWPEVEGRGGTAGGRFTDPVVTWSPAQASPSGAAILGDTLYVAALRGERLWTVPLRDGTTGRPRAELVGRYGRLRTVAVAPDGALWLTTSNTGGNRSTPGGDDRVLRFPAR
jgi:glucose/arabinose dehydrogenase